MKQSNNLPAKYIKDAIQNPLLFQEHNPLISESMSLLNSRLRKSFDSAMQQVTSKQLDRGSGRRVKRPKEGQDSWYNDENQGRQEDDEMDNSRAIEEFEREIEEKFKISVSNKLYTFPRLKITSIMDIISSSESEDDEEPASQPSSSQQPSNEHNPFDPAHYTKKMKTEYMGNEEIQQAEDEDQADRNFKKVKIQNVKVSDGSKKPKERKTESLKKEDHPHYSHREKPKNSQNKNHHNEVTHKDTKDKNKQRPTAIKGQRPTMTGLTKSHHHQPQQWAVKQPQKHNHAERLKTEMYNDMSGQSESITESKRRFYEEDFFIKK